MAQNGFGKLSRINYLVCRRSVSTQPPIVIFADNVKLDDGDPKTLYERRNRKATPYHALPGCVPEVKICSEEGSKNSQEPVVLNNASLAADDLTAVKMENIGSPDEKILGSCSAIQTEKLNGGNEKSLAALKAEEHSNISSSTNKTLSSKGLSAPHDSTAVTLESAQTVLGLEDIKPVILPLLSHSNTQHMLLPSSKPAIEARTPEQQNSLNYEHEEEQPHLFNAFSHHTSRSSSKHRLGGSKSRKRHSSPGNDRHSRRSKRSSSHKSKHKSKRHRKQQSYSPASPMDHSDSRDLFQQSLPANHCQLAGHPEHQSKDCHRSRNVAQLQPSMTATSSHSIYEYLPNPGDLTPPQSCRQSMSPDLPTKRSFQRGTSVVSNVPDLNKIMEDISTSYPRLGFSISEEEEQL